MSSPQTTDLDPTPWSAQPPASLYPSPAWSWPCDLPAENLLQTSGGGRVEKDLKPVAVRDRLGLLTDRARDSVLQASRDRALIRTRLAPLLPRRLITGDGGLQLAD
jgi:hypothetical protein